MKKITLYLCLSALILFASCNPEQPQPVDPTAHGTYAYLLNEGSWGSNNAEISRVNIADGAIETNWFSRANGRGLGDVAQDLLHYGNKLYATVYMSNVLEVIDPATGRSIKQLDFGTRGPRYLACHDGKVYVTCYDRTVARIDTATLAIEASCPLSGMQPEQLCVLGNKLYVCNSWQYDNNGNCVYDSTLSIVDIASFTEVATLVVGYNPGKVKALDSQRLLVLCAGDYGTHNAATLLLNTADNSLQPLPIAATNCDTYQGRIYSYAVTYDDDYQPTAAFYCDNTPILQSHSATLANAYGINVNPANGDLYVCNSPYGANADLYCFSPDGTERWHVEAANYASKIVF